MNKYLPAKSAVWLSFQSCSVQDFELELASGAAAASFPLAADIEKSVPIYDGDAIRRRMEDRAATRELMAEWSEVLLDGPGTFVVRRAYPDASIVDEVSDVLNSIIAKERASVTQRGDHFGKSGANTRLWNAHEKLCAAAPDLFARYYAIDAIALASEAWLGPFYQITAAVNIVHPNGEAQTPHRDYHMGFQIPEQLERYPAHAHSLSAALTLQGAVAHCDMPLESGPTKLLPYSQRYLPGYFAAHREDFRAYFERRHVQLPLAKGDMLFFNPALFHAAGSNTSKDIARFANLLQIGSGYGRSIELIDRARMTKILFPSLKAMAKNGGLNAREVEYVIAACAEGYSFPANLDVDSPASGMAPPSQQDILRRALAEDWDEKQLDDAIDGYIARRRTV